ncbi:hypothetical protein SUGI_0261880 [Cryptomeria japonica]|nr:hypothetical protein SUGI_0261880 [Cryptomeria japonica]
MSFNLHGESAEAAAEDEDSSHSWEKRRDICIALITKYSPMILCTQQALKTQLDDLQRALPGYEQFGISRKGSQDNTDEHCTIFYDKEKVERMEGGTFWLSESPSVAGSTSWGATVPSIATWVISYFYYIWLKSLTHCVELVYFEPPGFTFQIVNTNMDEVSARARRRGALLTWQHIASLPPSLPVVYCGGFNTQKESTAGRFLLGRSR